MARRRPSRMIAVSVAGTALAFACLAAAAVYFGAGDDRTRQWLIGYLVVTVCVVVVVGGIRRARGGRQAARGLGVCVLVLAVAVPIALNAPDDGLPVAVAALCLPALLFLWVVVRWQWSGYRRAREEFARRDREERSSADAL